MRLWLQQLSVIEPLPGEPGSATNPLGVSDSLRVYLGIDASDVYLLSARISATNATITAGITAAEAPNYAAQYTDFIGGAPKTAGGWNSELSFDTSIDGSGDAHVGLSSEASTAKISYTYNMELGEKDFRMLEDAFYSAENLEKLIKELQATDLNDYVKKTVVIEITKSLREFVSFKVLPSYFDIIKPSNAKNIDELEKFQQARGTLLIMHVTARSKEQLHKIALVCRNNFKQIIPLYSEKEQLNSKIISFKEEMAIIEEARYALNLQLERKKINLEKLKNSGSEGLDKLPSNIVLQFNNVGENSAYLPLPYQVQAAETQMINLEEQIMANKEMYAYYTGLLKLNEKLFSNIKKRMSSRFTFGQFHVFLAVTLAEYKEDEQQLQDYLKAYIKSVENKMANVMPLVEKPKVYSVAKGTVKKSAVVFVIALMMSVFVAFLLEGFKKSQVQTS